MRDASPSPLDAWLSRLEAAHPVGIDLGLERVAEVARRMGLLDGPVAGRVITVAGTNGKGSTVAMLDALARHHGLSAATYTSPHLLRYNERLCLDGHEADDATLIAGFEAVEAARLDGEPISLTYFEVGTLGALHAIRAFSPEVAILEVGLGGRLDAVNVLDADVAVVTTIARDHAAFLGDDLEGIGREKAGIMRAGRPAVLGSSDLPASVRSTAEALSASVHALGTAYGVEREAASWRWWCDIGQALRGLPDPGLPLDNAATALMALQLAGVELDETASRQALGSVVLPGRMQWRGAWCLDVGHNPQAAAYVAGRLAERPVAGRTFALLGMLGDKDADGVIEALAPSIDAWVPVTLEGERARSADELAIRLEALDQEVVHCDVSPAQGAAWLEAHLAPQDRVLVCGSFFTVGGVLAAWAARAQTETDDRPSEGMT
ncbi:bifunctional tetrahydrofolate synthase/dihydrofolate synthase [Halomonas caseinilytica]|uniref:bifunctional tetrahydrofolate synthase/dihydrofolate synthase n=1 Tax=Halomonas caseinilytica TaxID=438744 RepID=UPI0007E58E9F|nr:bifunctional tetrahydrofolate synthase/dihydrofolate synthase [Halomonas caseinilytica]SEM94345.1 dihydrofolate synthase / folylpolyglutamate synthase [Halomonas caseinilytica]